MEDDGRGSDNGQQGGVLLEEQHNTARFDLIDTSVSRILQGSGI